VLVWTRWTRVGIGIMINQSGDSHIAIADHKTIMEFLFSNASALGVTQPDSRPWKILYDAAALTEDAAQAELFKRAAADVAAYFSDTDAYGDIVAEVSKAIPFVSKILLFEGSHADLVAFVRHLKAGCTDDALRVGLDTAERILEDGAATIYNPEWILERMPRLAEHLADGNLQYEMDRIEFARKNTAKADATGAVSGAVRGAVIGGVTGAGAGPGAIIGGIAGAITNSIWGGMKKAY
jgi:hypothetical protein